MRGSPSLVGRGIANPMFARTRGFESHSPRYSWGFIKKNAHMNKNAKDLKRNSDCHASKPTPMANV